MKVYRLETSKGFGPFWGDPYIGHLLKDHSSPFRVFPINEADYGGNYYLQMLLYNGFVFGWSTKELMDNFPIGNNEAEIEHTWKIIHGNGFEVNEYETNGVHIVLKDGQVMFKRKPNQSDIDVIQTIKDAINGQSTQTY